MTEATHRLILMPSGRQGDVLHGMTVLDAARGLGVDIESICGGRLTCGKCLVSLERGEFLKHGITSAEDHLTPPGPDELAYAANHNLDLSQRRLACATCVVGDALLTVPEESLARKQVIRKAAGEMVVDVAPAVRLAYVEVEPPAFGCRGDWQRLQRALEDQWGLHDLTIDPPLLHDLQKTLRAGNWKATITIWQGQQVIRVEPGYVERLYGIAVDVGTTTVVVHLCDLLTGAVLATEAMMNPQVRYGEDLMSRVSYAASESGGLGRMHHAILHGLNELVTGAAREAGISAADVTDAVLVGNTVMHHILLGIDPVQLGQVPFALASDEAIDWRARDFGLKVIHPGARVHVLPCIAGYVGADAVGVLLAEYPLLDDGVSLIVDIGTNAEIILATRERMLAASSPTGPAFEGAQILHGQRAASGAIERFRLDPVTGAVRYRVVGDPRWSDELGPGEKLSPTGICGSGIIEIIAELFSAGIISASGRFPPTAAHPRVQPDGVSGKFVIAPAEETATGQDIVLIQQDIRSIQLAKAALYAGVRLLMEHLGVERADRIRLAGAFGSYIDPLFAMTIGLFPDCDLVRVNTVGNAAGDGARLALVNVDQRELARTLSKRVEYVETAAHPRFHELFVEAMSLPHAVDPFPHLERLRTASD